MIISNHLQKWKNIVMKCVLDNMLVHADNSARYWFWRGDFE